MSEPKVEYKASTPPPIKSTSPGTVSDEILLAMLEEVLMKLRASGWTVSPMLVRGKISGQIMYSVFLTGLDKPVIGLDRFGIVTLDGKPVTEVKQ
jgi:hypothetical protein